MGQITDSAKTVYSGGPSGSPDQPNKAEIIGLFQTIDTTLVSLVDGMIIGGAVIYSTRAALYADLAHAAGVLGVVYNDGTPAYNGVYVKSGASGSGSWAITGLALPSTFAADLAAVVSEVTTARGGEASLDARLDAIDATVGGKVGQSTFDTLNSEVTTARGGQANLDARLDAIDTEIAAKASQEQFSTVYGSGLLDSEYAEAFVSEDGTRVLGGFRHDGTVEWVDSFPLLDVTFNYAETDQAGNVLWGITHDDTFWAPGLGSGEGGSSVDDGTTKVMSRDGQIIVDRAGIRSPITFNDYNENPSVVGDFVSYMADTGSVLVNRTEEILCSTSLSGSVTAVRHYLMYGQSLSEGSESKPALHTSAVRPGWAVMFNAGTRPRGSGSGVQAVPASNEYAWVDALEAEQESPALAVSWGMTESGRLAATEAALVSAHGVGGRTYAELKQGTQPYENLKEAVRRARVIAARNGIDYSLEVVSWIHGEANRLDSKATYKAYMVELQADLTEDLNNLTDQTGEVLLALDQVSNFTAYNLTASEVPFAQLEAALENPSKMLCVGPKYMLPTVADGIHLPAASSAALGSYHARAIDQHRKWMEGAGSPWLPLYCTGAVRVGALVTLTMHVPVGALTLDTAAVSNPGNYGITWSQTGGTARTISSVAIDGNTIEVTLSGDPGSPTLETIGIAAVGVSGNDAGPTTGARSNFRDEATETDIDGNVMRNWACHQLITL